MKTLVPSISLTVLLSTALLLSSVSAQGRGRGAMPAEARDTIHKLFDNHEALRRTVKKTPDGYIATTESDDPALAKALKRHLSQMEERLESGLMVRRWDPAFEEYVLHYDDIVHEVTSTKKGLKITVRGETKEAARVARNHAKVISAFVANGWAEHDAQHAAIGDAYPAAAARGRGGPQGEKPCCLTGGKRSADCGSQGRGKCRGGKGNAGGAGANAKANSEAKAGGKGQGRGANCPRCRRETAAVE